MQEFLKYVFIAFLIFWVAWLIWYLRGGPLDPNRDKMFIVPTGNGFNYENNVNTGVDTIKDYTKNINIKSN